MIVQIEIPGKPIAQKRHRHTSRGKFVRTYDPSSKDKTAVKKEIKLIGLQDPALKKLFKHPFAGPLSVSIIAFYPMPKAWSKKKRKEMENAFRPVKPDNDNIAKFYYDTMNGFIYEDDNQIVHSLIEKRYSINPRTLIIINSLEEQNK